MLLSEYPPGTASSKITFPQRNRIISGLSQGIVVVEAGLKSGALITADCARKQGRRVFVMTGPTFRSSFEGAVELLKNGAKLITSAEDILGYPMVLKECFGSFGAQVHLANNRLEAEDIIKNKIVDRDFIMQEFISESFGRDVRINVVKGRAVASMMRHNPKDFRSNITGGGVTVPYTPTPSQIDAAIRAADALGLDFAGVDVLFGKNDTPYICEVNSNPHFKTTLDCTGINIAEHILDGILEDIEG
jgi:RimK family alpha-L-glutamate ligase